MAAWIFRKLDKSFISTGIRTPGLSTYSLYCVFLAAQRIFRSKKKFMSLRCSLYACWKLGLTFRTVMFLYYTQKQSKILLQAFKCDTFPRCSCVRDILTFVISYSVYSALENFSFLTF